jgi:metacaspase-1
VKLALCIGINDYPGTGSDLHGCVNDANDWAAELSKRDFDVRIMLDAEATGDAMRAGIRERLDAAATGDTVVITYSGHGTWVPDRDGDEPDRRDEALCPYDIGTNGPQLDDE